jgi:predicted trehalose synthase
MIEIEEGNLKNGVLGLVLAVVEVIRDALQNQATRRIESGTLTDEEVERLGTALADLDVAIEDIKREQGLGQAVQSVRDGLDDLVDNLLERMTASGGWARELAGSEEAPPAGGE